MINIKHCIPKVKKVDPAFGIMIEHPLTRKLMTVKK